MFARRDWRLLGLIVLAQVGLVVCYFCVQPWLNRQQPTEAKPNPRHDSVVVAVTQGPAVAAEQETEPKFFPETAPPPEAPGSVVPAILNQSAPLTEPEDHPSAPTNVVPPLPALPDLRKKEDV